MSDDNWYQEEAGEDPEFGSILTSWQRSYDRLLKLLQSKFKYNRSDELMWHDSYMIDNMLVMLGRLMNFTSDLENTVTDPEALKREYTRLHTILSENALRLYNEIEFLKKWDQQGYLPDIPADVPMLSHNYDLNFALAGPTTLRDPYKELTREHINPDLNDHLPLNLSDEFRIVFVRKHYPEIKCIELELYPGSDSITVFPVSNSNGKVISRQSKIPFFKRERSTLYQLIDSNNIRNGIPAPGNTGKLFGNLNLLMEKVLLINNFVLESERPNRWYINPLYRDRIYLKSDMKLMRRAYRGLF